MRVVLATSNQHKLLEFQQILAPWGYDLTTPATLGVELDVDEVGDTFAANAVLKCKCNCINHNASTGAFTPKL
jgi:XTP/dITP diphosphohydrolase